MTISGFFVGIITLTSIIPSSLNPTQVVTVVPKYGYATSPIRVRLSHSEVEIVKKLQKQSLNPSIVTSSTLQQVQFRIEPSAATSKTIALGLKSLAQSAALFEDSVPDYTQRPFIVIGRSQEFIAKTLTAIGCAPDLAAVGGSFIMGATVCNRQVIVINLTGYLFLKSRQQKLTSEMEALPEPPLAATSYLIADRNIAGLAHEWTHIARANIAHGIIADNEPAWFREGLAEVVSGMASVRAFAPSLKYQDFHVIRLRKFANWQTRCTDGLVLYRRTTFVANGCEYFRGALALELLIANYGGLQKVKDLYRLQHIRGDFFGSFKTIYGMSIATFEMRADRYSQYIVQAESLRR